MNFNKVYTQQQADSFNFLANQSSVLHTQLTNDVNINGVNVITATPTVGDVLCITRKSSAGTLLGPDQQDIVWMKGMTISFKEFPADTYEPVGVVYKVRGRTAYVLYRESPAFRFSTCDRFKIVDEIDYITDGELHDNIYITITSGTTTILSIDNTSFQTLSMEEFADWLAEQFAAVSGNNRVSAEYVNGECMVNVVLPSSSWCDMSVIRRDEQSGDYEILTAERCLAKDIAPYLAIKNYGIRNNGATYATLGGCNFNKFLDYCSTNGTTPTKTIATILNNNTPVTRTAFNNSSYCAILRANYSTYEDYIRANMFKWPIGPINGNVSNVSAIGVYADKGPEYTKSLAAETYLDTNSAYQPLFPAAYYCNTVGVNHTLLTPGKWWMPSAADMMDLMDGITYNTSAWSESPDIVSQVLIKLNDDTASSSNGFHFSMLNTQYYWTSTISENLSACRVWQYYYISGYLNTLYMYYDSIYVTPITRVEF